METSALQVNIYARYSWTLNFEDSLASHSYCDTSSDFKVTPEDLWHSHLLPSIWQWNSQCYLFYDFGLSGQGFEHLTFCMWGKCYNPMHHHGGFGFLLWHFIPQCNNSYPIVANWMPYCGTLPFSCNFSLTGFYHYHLDIMCTTCTCLKESSRKICKQTGYRKQDPLIAVMIYPFGKDTPFT